VRRFAGVATGVFPNEPERSVYNDVVLERGLAAGERAEATGAMEPRTRARASPAFAAWVHESDEAIRFELERRGSCWTK
jgi:hypothetical protein